MEKNCEYRLINRGAYEDTWSSGCGKIIKYEGPIEIGMGFNPSPTDGGSKYCRFCGGQIKEVRK